MVKAIAIVGRDIASPGRLSTEIRPEPYRISKEYASSYPAISCRCDAPTVEKEKTVLPKDGDDPNALDHHGRGSSPRSARVILPMV